MEYLNLVGSLRKLPDLRSRADWWFDFLDFADKKNVLCKDLSRGTRQKLMFTQAFIHQPELALIDEPLINFDPIMQRKIKDYLAEYVRSGRTIFISTHILSIAEEICSGFAILHKGRLLHTSTPQELSREEMNSPALLVRFHQPCSRPLQRPSDDPARWWAYIQGRNRTPACTPGPLRVWSPYCRGDEQPDPYPDGSSPLASIPLPHVIQVIPDGSPGIENVLSPCMGIIYLERPG